MDITSIHNKVLPKESPKSGQAKSPAARQGVSGETSDAKQKKEKLKTACADFEGILLDYMFQSMRNTLPGDGLFGHSLQKDIYESMLYQEMSKKIARGKGVGIGEALYRQLQHTDDSRHGVKPKSEPSNPDKPEKLKVTSDK